MRILLDTSVMVSALLPSHRFHVLASPWLAQAKAGAFEFIYSAHSLAELYAVLTRMLTTPAISPAIAAQLIRENVVSSARIVALSAPEYMAVVDELASQGIAGGAVYDAVIAKVAEQSSVDLLATFNVAHFQRVWQAATARIVNPQTTPVP